MKAPRGGTRLDLRLWALAALICYLIVEVLALAVMRAPTLPVAVLVADIAGFGASAAMVVLSAAVVAVVALEVLFIASKRAPGPAAPASQPAPAKGIERSTINSLLGDSSKNFVEVFPLKTGVINVYGAITKEEGVEGYRYLVIEPELTATEKKQFAQLNELLVEEMDVDLRSIETREKAEAFLTGKVSQLAQTYGFNIPRPSMRKLQYYFARDFIHLGKIEPLMLDPLIEDISCDGAKIPIYVWHRDYESIPTNIVFETDQELDSFVSKLAYVSGKHVSLALPMVDASLQDGSRLHLTYGKEVTQRGSTFTIRRFKADPFTIVDLIKYNTLNPEVAAYLWYLVEKRLAMLVAGSTACGKTTSLNCLSMFVAPGQKIISIEDSVTGDAEVLVHESGVTRKVKIGHLVDSAIDRGGVVTELGHELARPDDLRVLTMGESGRITWAPCTALIRHRVTKEFVKLTTRMGRTIEVTSDHSLFAVGSDGRVEAVPGKEIAPGTYLATPKSIEMPGRPVSFDLESLQEFSQPRFETRGVENRNGTTVQQLRVNATRSPLSVPSVIELDDDLAFLSGLWLADGFYDSASVGFSVGRKDVEARLRRITERYGAHLTRHGGGVSLLIRSVPFRAFLEKSLCLTGDEYSRRVPGAFFGAPQGVVASLLRGYFAGDGNVSAGGVHAESASRELLLDLQTLILRFGVRLRVGTRKVGAHGGVGTYRASIAGTSQVSLFRSLVGFEQEGRMLEVRRRSRAPKYHLDPIPVTGTAAAELKSLRWRKKLGPLGQRVKAGVRRGVVSRQTILELAEERPEAKESRAYMLAASDLYFDEVVHVERETREAQVYDLSVPETGTFVANNIVCHNTPELSLPQENWIQEVSRAEGSVGEITLFDLVRNALRQRPDVIIVGEIRGKEAFTLFQAISTGHGGMSTIHADSVEAVFNRLTTEPMSLPRSLVGTSLDCIVMQLKLRIGDRSVRRVVSVNEILGYDNRTNEMVMNEVYKWDPVTDRLNATGRSRLVDKINQRYGLRPEEIRRDLDSRKVFLEWLASKNFRSYKEVSQYVQEFYGNPYAMASRARTELEAAT
ncbi:MAG: Flp pilus assembly complex ATPase component TadA [Nitrososphaerota archaeon]|nr:Flp pilus assembly complex ATPase component TadA [Nitrososphaerota archaeon]